MVDYPYQAQSLKVEQPLGTYFVAVLPAELLLEVCFSDRLRAYKEEGGPYRLDGTQRSIDQTRLKTIGSFISRSDAAFPNSVILAANSRMSDGLVEESSARWSVAPSGGDSYTIRIPSKEKLAAVIDGQHRLFSFTFAAVERLSMSLICSVFFDLPKPYQAQLFATINSTQKPVDKSLTYELFGYNVLDEPESFWSPDKLAVFFARKLNTEEESPLRGRVTIAPENDFALADGDASWRVSMATVVEGILRLISSNPKQDSNELLDPAPSRREILSTSQRKDRSPLRSLYLEGNDRLLYVIVANFLAACKSSFWASALPGSFIVKTVGIQALFDVLRELAPAILSSKVASVAYFSERLAPASDINFADESFRNASGSGRTHIKNTIKQRLGLS